DLLNLKGFVAPMKSGGFQLRGLSSEYVLVMIDGVPIAGRESGALDLSNINLANVERVEIVKGSMSALWGNHAIGGVINIITKKGGEPSLMLNAQYGTNNSSLVGLTSTMGKGNFKNTSKITYGKSDGFDIDPLTYGNNVLPFSLLNVTNRSTYNDGVNGSETIVCCFNNTLSYGTINDLNSTALTVTFNWYRVDSWDDAEPFKIIVNSTTIFNNNFASNEANLSQTNSGYTTTFTNRISNQNRGDYIRYGNNNAGWYDQSFLVTITTPEIDSFAMTLDADNMQSASDESYGVRDFAYTGGSDGSSTASISTNTSLSISAGSGDITFTDAIGGTKALNDVTLVGAIIDTDA
ncbi:MAG: hypothetical protein EBZ28_08105, partial [Alphaproteobacteria bacterium]|nr:hypothetical protein [Alphaproteobacteria bacterium]